MAPATSILPRPPAPIQSTNTPRDAACCWRANHSSGMHCSARGGHRWHLHGCQLGHTRRVNELRGIDACAGDTPHHKVLSCDSPKHRAFWKLLRSPSRSAHTHTRPQTQAHVCPALLLCSGPRAHRCLLHPRWQDRAWAVWSQALVHHARTPFAPDVMLLRPLPRCKISPWGMPPSPVRRGRPSRAPPGPPSKLSAESWPQGSPQALARRWRPPSHAEWRPQHMSGGSSAFECTTVKGVGGPLDTPHHLGAPPVSHSG